MSIIEDYYEVELKLRRLVEAQDRYIRYLEGEIKLIEDPDRIIVNGEELKKKIKEARNVK